VIRVFETLIGGLANGAIFAIVGLCAALVYSVTRALDCAVANVAILAAIVASSLQSSSVGLPLIVLVVAVGSLAVGGVEYALVFSRPRLRGASANATILTLGLAFLMIGAMQAEWGPDAHTTTPFSGRQAVTVGRLAIPTQDFWALGLVLVVGAGMAFFLARTDAGRGFRACAENPSMAACVGINVSRTRAITVVTACLLAGIAGLTIAPLTYFTYQSGLTLILQAFTAAAFGGWGTARGAVAGGLLLGVIESFFSGYVSASYLPVFTFGVLLAVLTIRPSGLFMSSSLARAARA
jgi:branched-chain amino acid transport system permease protein